MNENKIKDAFYAYLKDDLEADKLIGALEKLRQQWLQLRQQEHDMQWRQNISFYAGNHFIRDTGRNANQYRVKLRENHTNNVIQRMVATFTQNMPVTRVFPASSSYQDAQNAENTEQWAKFLWRKNKLENTFSKLVKYSAITGNGFIYREFDPYAQGKMQMDQDETGKSEQTIDIWRGEPKVTVDDPFRIIVRPGIDELDDMHDFIRSVPANKQEMESIHGEISSEPATSLNAYNGTLRTDDDIIMVNHYYHKPTHWCDEGMYVCWAGKKVLKAVKFPYKDGVLPLVHLPFDKPPMRFWATSSIDQVIDLQEQVNRAASMIVEARNLMARPRVMVSHEAQVPGQSLTDRPGDILRYKLAGGKPEFHVPSFNFGEMSAHKQDVRAALQQVSGMTAASRGEIPQAARTALALQLVLEMDRSQWSPFIKTFYQCINDTMYGTLGMAAQFIPDSDPRTIKIEKNNVVGSKTFHGGMVPSPLDVWVEDTNPLGWTATGRIEAIQALVQMGAIKDPNKVLEMLKLNNSDPAYELVNLNHQAAQKENEILLQGKLLDIMPEDDDPIHLDDHTKIVVSFDFREKPKVVQDAILAHIEQHKQRMAPPPGAAPGAAAGITSGGAQAMGQVADAAQLQMPGQNVDQLLGK